MDINEKTKKIDYATKVAGLVLLFIATFAVIGYFIYGTYLHLHNVVFSLTAFSGAGIVFFLAMVISLLLDFHKDKSFGNWSFFLSLFLAFAFLTVCLIYLPSLESKDSLPMKIISILGLVSFLPILVSAVYPICGLAKRKVSLWFLFAPYLVEMGLGLAILYFSFSLASSVVSLLVLSCLAYRASQYLFMLRIGNEIE
ncbi:MAG: hypothetical protein LKF75_00770 [Bacilli bacterium]|jgi:hypothetical protein|nr:hypothetical protein [Bacilli bacterium]MCH4210736.1 hypothetical protein [Bacilli bacterium]MCH4228229.1 hypothetical protein [Bacilli bacterium]MCI2055260.1 hypothetical protein [Bacilli bacterium]